MRTIVLSVSVTALAMATAAGCAGAGGAKGSQVSDADLGRLGPGQMGPVNEARQYVASARDELARAKLRQQDTAHETELAKADESLAGAEAERAKVESSLAEQSRDPAQVERARLLQQKTQLQKSAADAHVRYAKKLEEANNASLEAGSKQVDLANQRLELAKLQALLDANNPAATKYDITKFQARVNDAQKSFDDALQRARNEQDQARLAQQEWQNVQRQMQALGNAIQTG